MLRSLLQIRCMSSAVPLTTTRYPHIKRKEFAVLSDKDISHFESVVGNGNVLQKDIDGFNTDWLSTVRGVLYVIHVWPYIHKSSILVYAVIHHILILYIWTYARDYFKISFITFADYSKSFLALAVLSMLAINDLTKLGTPLLLTSSVCRTFFFYWFSGQSAVVLRPASVQEVSALLKYCNDRRLAVCPQGGNTGEAGLSTLFLIAPNALTRTQFLMR